MKNTVLIFGTYDGLHPGHEDFFRQAREHGDTLVVVVARDVTVLDVKGNLPANSEQHRLNLLKDHPLIDDARLGYPGDKYRIIEEIQPDVIFLGYDQEAFTDNLDAELVRRGLSATIHRGVSFFPETYKSSLLRGARVEEEESYAEAEYEENGLPI